jgi:hypothetical protein
VEAVAHHYDVLVEQCLLIGWESIDRCADRPFLQIHKPILQHVCFAGPQQVDGTMGCRVTDDGPVSVTLFEGEVINADHLSTGARDGHAS